MTNRIRTIATLLFAAVFAIGCASSQLEPREAANVRDDGGITASAGDVEKVVLLEAWNGMSEVRSEVEPVKLVITNNSAVSIRVDPEDVKLVGSGVEKSAVNLERFRADIRVPAATVTSMSGVDMSNATGDGPGAGWVDITLPTKDMRAGALKDTTLEPGQSIAGFVYFPQVDDIPGETELYLVAPIESNGQSFSELKVPLRTR